MVLVKKSNCTRQKCLKAKHSAFKGSALHHLIVAYYFHRHFLIGSGQVSGSDHITKDTLSSVAIHPVPFVQYLADVHT